MRSLGPWEVFTNHLKDSNSTNTCNRREYPYLWTRNKTRPFSTIIWASKKTRWSIDWLFLKNGSHHPIKDSNSHSFCYPLWIHGEPSIWSIWFINNPDLSTPQQLLCKTQYCWSEVQVRPKRRLLLCGRVVSNKMNCLNESTSHQPLRQGSSRLLSSKNVTTKWVRTTDLLKIKNCLFSSMICLCRLLTSGVTRSLLKS